MSPLLLPLLLLAARRTDAQVFFKGECPDPPTVVDFKLWLFEGTWYETQRWYTIKEKSHCMRHTFTDLGYGTLDVLTEMNRKKSYEYRRGLAKLSVSKSSKGYGYEKHSYGQTKYTLQYDDKRGEKGNAETFFVLDTDYWTYAIIWSCSNKKIFNMQYLRILTRSPYPHSHTLLKVYRELEYLGLDQQHLSLVDDKQRCHYQVAQTHHKKGYGHDKGHGKGGGKGGGGHSLPRPAYPVSYTSLLSQVKPGGGQGGGLEQSYTYGQGGYGAGSEAAAGGGGYEQVGGGYGGEAGAGGGGYEQVGGGGGGYGGGGGVDVIGPWASQGYSGGGGGYSGGVADGYSGGGGGYSGGGAEGYSGGGGGYEGRVAGEGYSEDVLLGYVGGGGGGEGYSSSGYSAPSSGYSAPSSGYSSPSSGYSSPSSGYSSPSSGNSSPSTGYSSPSTGYSVVSDGYGGGGSSEGYSGGGSEGSSYASYSQSSGGQY